MPVDLLWLSVGFVVGVAATAFALEVALRGVRNDERASLSKDWSLDELDGDEGPPRIVTTSLDGVRVPDGARVLVGPGARLPASLAQRCEIRLHDEADGNFAVGNGKALLCTGPVEVGTLALETVHPALVSRLESSFDSLWVQGEPYKEPVEPDQIDDKEGSLVEVSGRVEEVLASGDKALLRMAGEDTRGHGNVLVPSNLPVEEGKAYRFSGTVVEEGGRTAVKAEHVEEIPLAEV
jgi:hypothetical protein